MADPRAGDCEDLATTQPDPEGRLEVLTAPDVHIWVEPPDGLEEGPVDGHDTAHHGGGTERGGRVATTAVFMSWDFGPHQPGDKRKEYIDDNQNKLVGIRVKKRECNHYTRNVTKNDICKTQLFTLKGR